MTVLFHYPYLFTFQLITQTRKIFLSPTTNHKMQSGANFLQTGKITIEKNLAQWKHYMYVWVQKKINLQSQNRHCNFSTVISVKCKTDFIQCLNFKLYTHVLSDYNKYHQQQNEKVTLHVLFNSKRKEKYLTNRWLIKLPNNYIIDGFFITARCIWIYCICAMALQ